MNLPIQHFLSKQLWCLTHPTASQVRRACGTYRHACPIQTYPEPPSQHLGLHQQLLQAVRYAFLQSFKREAGRQNCEKQKCRYRHKSWGSLNTDLCVSQEAETQINMHNTVQIAAGLHQCDPSSYGGQHSCCADSSVLFCPFQHSFSLMICFFQKAVVYDTIPWAAKLLQGGHGPDSGN